MPSFEENNREDYRLGNAIETLHTRITTGVFKRGDIRKAASAAYAAAREVGEDTATRYAACVGGQAVATAHVPSHSSGAANFELQAIHRFTDYFDADVSRIKDQNWQYQHLLKLRAKEALE